MRLIYACSPYCIDFDLTLYCPPAFPQSAWPEQQLGQKNAKNLLDQPRALLLCAGKYYDEQMIQTNDLYRTFFIKAEQYGTAFTLDVDGVEYLVTAKHLLNASEREFELQIFHDKKWLRGRATVVGHARGEIDISVLRVDSQLTPPGFDVTPSLGEIVLGQDVFFLGFPYKMWGDVGALLRGLPCPFVKKGVLSSVNVETPQVIYVDAINNEGFSGGPLFFHPMDKPNELRIAGVVSKFRVEQEAVLDELGVPTKMTVPYNTGFLVAYGIKHAVELIRPQTRV